MKKVSITINEGSPGRTLPVFGSVEAAYVWYTESYENPNVLDSIEEVDRVIIEHGDVVEAEWRGCEFSGTGTSTVRVDLVRFAKCHPPQNEGGMLISLHYGWVVDCIIPFRDFIDNDITVKKLTPETERVNLAVMFKDDERAEEEKKVRKK